MSRFSETDLEVAESVLIHLPEWERPPLESLVAATEWGGSLIVGDRRFSVLYEGTAVLETVVSTGEQTLWRDGQRM